MSIDCNSGEVVHLYPDMKYQFFIWIPNPKDIVDWKHPPILRRLLCVWAIELPQTLNGYDKWSYDSLEPAAVCVSAMCACIWRNKKSNCVFAVCIWWTAKINFSIWIQIAISMHEQSIDRCTAISIYAFHYVRVTVTELGISINWTHTIQN